MVKKYKEFLSAKVARFSDFEGNANGFTVLTGTRPGIRGVFLCYTRSFYEVSKVCQRNQQVILLIKVWFLSNR
jgi:hypothetical protein